MPDTLAAASDTTALSVVTNYQPITRVPGPANPKRMVQAIGVMLALGLAALFGRFVRNETRAARNELEGWELPSQDRAADADHAQLVGTNVVTAAASSAADVTDADGDREDPDAWSSTQFERPRSSAPDSSADLRTRLIYHVGPYHFARDREVLGQLPQTHLQDLCDLLCSPDNKRRVLRIAGGLSCRYAKSQVAAQLAQMLAERPNVRVLALEGDLDAPALHRVMQLHVPRTHGLSEQLQRMADLDRVDSVTVLHLSPSLHALVESRWSTPAALALPQYAQLLMRQRDVYDFIVVDGPVVDSWPDADHFGALIDGVVFVTLAGSRLPDTLKLMGQHFTHDLLLRIVKTGEASNL